MKASTRRLGSLVAATALLAAGSAPARGQDSRSKEQRHDEMTSIAREMRAIKGNPLADVRFLELDARYRQLSASLGGDDPGALLGSRPVPAPEALGNGVVPPGCVSSVDGFASADTPLPINDMATTTSVISVSGAGGYLQDLNVVTDITHTFAADLEITVTSPAGTVVTLTTDNGAGNDNVFAGTLWDDDGGDANPPGAATDNVYANLVVETPLVPEEALGAFIGEDPNGTWTIAVFDDAGADQGTLNSWSLSVTSLATAPIVLPTVEFASTDTPLPINDMQTTTSTITVSGVDAFVCEIEILTEIAHTFAADLEIDVTSPGGTVSTLTTDNGAGNDNVFNGTVWDDDGGATNPPGPATDNVYANLVVETPLVPEEALGAFVGEDANGAWTISIFDDAGADQGTLNTWSVGVRTCSCIQPDADLSVTKTGTFDSTSEQITWTITVTNNGPDDATGVTVTDPLDPCTTFVGDDCGGVVVPPWTWNVGALANGASATCNVVVDASACPVGPVGNTATAAGNETDPTPGNDAATATVGVGSLLEIPTLGRAGLLLLLLAISLGALIVLRRKG